MIPVISCFAGNINSMTHSSDGVPMSFQSSRTARAADCGRVKVPQQKIVAECRFNPVRPLLLKKAPAKKDTKGMAGGLGTVEVQGAMDTRAARRRPSDTLPRKTLFE
jgi:hypothetical protein